MLLQLILFTFALWLGLYLLTRRTEKTALRLAGFGLAAYALALASDLLNQGAPNPTLAENIARLHWLSVFWPALFWSGALAYSLPEEAPLRARLTALWRWGLTPAAALFSLLAFGTPLVVTFTAARPQPGLLYWLWAVLVILPLIASAFLLSRTLAPPRAARPWALLLISALFFALSTGLMLFPLELLPRAWMLFLLGLDLGFLGVTIIALDAFDEGEAWQADLLRSLAASELMAAVFGGLVALAALLGAGWTFPMVALLIATLAVAIAVPVFADRLQAALDRLVFARLPRLRQARAELREISEALPRMDSALDPLALDEAEFVRLTRRAISHLGNLPRLAASPLTQLPIIQGRLTQRGANGNALERAAELKALLIETIRQLKPGGRGDFGASDEWRHYNALYFPYVAGLKPYSRRADGDGLDPTARAALDWFQAAVPERTLHNWQNAAARLVALNLLERHKSPNWQ